MLPSSSPSATCVSPGRYTAHRPRVLVATVPTHTPLPTFQILAHSCRPPPSTRGRRQERTEKKTENRAHQNRSRRTKQRSHTHSRRRRISKRRLNDRCIASYPRERQHLRVVGVEHRSAHHAHMPLHLELGRRLHRLAVTQPVREESPCGAHSREEQPRTHPVVYSSVYRTPAPVYSSRTHAVVQWVPLKQQHT